MAFPNSLKMNSNKTGLILLATGNLIANTMEFELSINDDSLQPKKRVKMLGVFLYPSFNREQHASHVVR